MYAPCLPATCADKLEAYASGWKATLGARFEFVANCTRITDRKHCGPLQIQKALYPEGPSICHATILHPPGGLAEGDDLALDFQVGPSAQVVLSTPAATKWYKAPNGWSRQRVSLQARRKARLEWLPQENILFDQSHPRMDLQITVGDDACALGWDMFSLGRRAAGESWHKGSLEMKSEIVREDGDLLWAEQAVLPADSDVLNADHILAGFPVFGTLWAYGPNCTPALAQGVTCPWSDQIRSGATCLPGNVLLIRAVSRQMETLRIAMTNWRADLRPIILGVLPAPLRLWST